MSESSFVSLKRDGAWQFLGYLNKSRKWGKNQIPRTISFKASTGVWMRLYGYNTSRPVHRSFLCVRCILAVKLLHHELPAGLITQEQCSVSREGADHGGGKTRVESPHAYTKEAAKVTL